MSSSGAGCCYFSGSGFTSGAFSFLAGFYTAFGSCFVSLTSSGSFFFFSRVFSEALSAGFSGYFSSAMVSFFSNFAMFWFHSSSVL
jgi:hypothetical protein